MKAVLVTPNLLINDAGKLAIIPDSTLFFISHSILSTLASLSHPFSLPMSPASTPFSQIAEFPTPMAPSSPIQRAKHTPPPTPQVWAALGDFSPKRMVWEAGER